MAGTFLAYMVVITFGSTETKGKTMNPEEFFSERQLLAYRLAQKGEVKEVVQIATSGLDLNRPGKEDLTVLGFAVVTADRRAITTLMRAGADPNQVIPNAGTPAILAITKHYNPPQTAAVEALLDAGYDPNQLLGQGKPYLFYFVDYKHVPGLKLALSRGGDINVKRNNGKSLLTYVLEGGDYALARDLIEMGADVSARAERGESALEAVEFDIKDMPEVTPDIADAWKELLVMRELILSRLQNAADRRTAFTAAAEKRIRELSSKE